MTASFDRTFIVSLSMMYLPRACSYSCGLSCRDHDPQLFSREVVLQLPSSKVCVMSSAAHRKSW